MDAKVRAMNPVRPRASGFTRFETPLGACAIAWSSRGVLELALPDARGDRSLARLRRRHGPAAETSPPDFAAAAIAGVVELLGGERPDLRGIELDQRGIDEFDRRVYASAREIPASQTRTYGELAQAIGAGGQAREVGAALARNPVPIIVPCHRVVAADGGLGGFSAPGRVATKRRLLALEGAPAAPALFDAA